MLSRFINLYKVFGGICIIPLLSSCFAQHIDYEYDDIVITRYDIVDFGLKKTQAGGFHSIYFCNKSDWKNYIRIEGSQNFYVAFLLIDTISRKVWIAPHNSLATQHQPDYIFFQADINHDSIKSHVNISNDYAIEFEPKYECYPLCAYGEKMEIRLTKKYFPNTKIKARYGKEFL